MRIPLAVAGALLAAAGVAAAPAFLQTLSPGEKAAAGLHKLTTEELSQLGVLVERYKSGGSDLGAAAAPTAPRAKAAGESVPSAAAPVDESVKKTPGRLAKLQQGGGGERGGETLESRIAGEFRGWSGRTVFTLEDGTRWRLANSGEYICPPIEAPKARVTPSAFGGYWLEIEGVRQRVRVLPLEAK